VPLTRVNGVDLYHEWHGPEAAPVMVFVNGLLTDISSWTPHLPAFTERYRCLVYDCRGQGRSSKPDEPYRPTLHAADLGALCDALGIERALFVGLSNGGTALLYLAAERPELVRALVVSGVFAHADPLQQAKLRSWATAMETGSAPLRFDVSMPWVWGARFLAANHERVMKFRDRALLMPEEAAINLIRGAMDHDARPVLPRVTSPALVLVGEEDVLTPHWLAEDVARRMPNARAEVVAGGGHAVAIEDPDAFSARVLAFFAEVR
jgi:3-oxoadipate enol-lactonase